MKIVACIEARYSSTRLPGKMLIDIEGEPLLSRVINRIKKSKKIHEIIIATSINSADQKIVNFSKKKKINYFRGSEENVLDRVLKANQFFNSDIVVEVCGDCPLIDPKIIDNAIEVFLNNQFDVVCTGGNIQSYPQGTEVMVFKRSLLESSVSYCNEDSYKEHVGLFFLENPSKYKVKELKAPISLHKPNLRLQVDYQEDLNLVKKIYADLLPLFGDNFLLEDVINLLNKKKHYLEINKNCKEKPVR